MTKNNPRLYLLAPVVRRRQVAEALELGAELVAGERHGGGVARARWKLRGASAQRRRASEAPL